MSPRLPLLLLLLALLPGHLPGQSLLGTRGLGYPLEALDARSRALGSVGAGLKGVMLLPSDPGSGSLVLVPAVTLTLQHQWASGTLEGEEVESQGARFPVMGLAYPVAPLRAMISLTFGGVLDQRWELRHEGTVELMGSLVPVRDTYRSEGGVSALRLGWTQRVGQRLSLGASVGSHTGFVSRSFTRYFDPDSAGPDVRPFVDGGKWRYSGLTTALGLTWDPSDLLRLGGSLTWSGKLKGEPVGVTEGEGGSYDLPLELRLGATGLVTPRLSLHAGVSRAGWSASPGGLDPGVVAGTLWSAGGGLEWTGPRLGNRDLPLRLGYRRADLPFRFGEGDPRESVLSGGLGLHLSQVEDLVLAGVDLALERGTREAGPLSERFWRGSVTVRLVGW